MLNAQPQYVGTCCFLVILTIRLQRKNETPIICWASENIPLQDKVIPGFRYIATFINGSLVGQPVRHSVNILRFILNNLCSFYPIFNPICTTT